MTPIDKSLFHPHLQGGSFFFPGNDTGILLIHGYTATTAEVRLLADRFEPLGYTIAAPLLPGHGTTLDELDRCHWSDWTNAAEAAYSDLKPRVKRIIIAGESMGGLLSLYLAANHPEVALVLVYSPAVKVKNLWQCQFIYPFVPYIPKKSLDDEMPWQGYRYNSIKAGAELYKLQRHVKRNTRSIHQPVAVFLGSHDQTIDLGGARRLYNQLPCSQNALYEYNYSGHCMILDHEVDAIFKQSLNFIQQNLPA
jgi:carboxylesterase